MGRGYFLNFSLLKLKRKLLNIKLINIPFIIVCSFLQQHLRIQPAGHTGNGAHLKIRSFIFSEFVVLIKINFPELKP